MAHMVKWKFSVFNNSKGHKAKGYINYIAKQVKERRDGKSGFALENSEGKIGEDDRKTLEQRLNDAKTPEEYQKLLYLKYIDERKGSNGLFSDEGIDTDELVRKLCANETVAWKPIVSLKESEAREYGLDTEAAWMEKATELAEEYRKVLGISKENYNWVAAFHTKSEADQNKDADAGCQPHLHFILWETDPIRRVYKMNDKEIERIHTITASVLSREYMQQQYAERNRLRDELKSDAMKNLEDYSQRVVELAMDIHILTGKEGRLNVKELEKRQAVALNILDKMETKKKLTDAENYYKNKFDINTIDDAKKVSSDYTDVIDRLDKLTDEALKMPQTQELLAKWNDVSDKMRKAHGDNLSQDLMMKDYLQLQKEIKNAILKETKNVDTENTKINNRFKGMMFDRLEKCQFDKNNLTQEQFTDTLSVITQLCKATNVPQEETVKMETQLLVKSDMEYYQEMMEELVNSIYSNYRISSLNVTSMDYWNAMRTLRYPRQRNEVFDCCVPANSYEMANKVILNPITYTILGTDERNISKVLDANNSWMIATTGNYTDYEEKYNQISRMFDIDDDRDIYI